MGSIVYHLSSHKVGDYDCLLHSGSNCLLEDLYSLKATQKADSRPSSSRSRTGSSKWRLIKLFEASQVSSWNILRMYCVFALLFAFLYSFLFVSVLFRPSSLISLHKAWHYLMSLLFLNSYLNPVIYCWKMEPIRRTLMDIMRGIVNRFRE